MAIHSCFDLQRAHRSAHLQTTHDKRQSSSHVIDVHEKAAADARGMAVVHADAEKNSDGRIDRRATQIENASVDERLATEKESREGTNLPTLDASSESEATAPKRHRMKEDSPSKP